MHGHRTPFSPPTQYVEVALQIHRECKLESDTVSHSLSHPLVYDERYQFYSLLRSWSHYDRTYVGRRLSVHNATLMLNITVFVLGNFILIGKGSSQPIKNI